MNFLDLCILIFQIVVLLIILVRSIMVMLHHERPVTMIFFVFAIVGYLLSNTYWLAYELLYPQVRMPFAANEIGEWAVFLSLGACLSARIKKISAPVIKELIGTSIFVVANVCLWIGWSGEWIQDIITGLVLIYFYTNLVRFMKQSEILSNGMWIGLACICVIIIAANAAGFFVPKDLVGLYDTIAYIMLFIVMAYFLIRTVISFVDTKKNDIFISFSYASIGWAVIFLYMSSEIVYNIVSFLTILSFFLAHMAHEKEVRA